MHIYTLTNFILEVLKSKELQYTCICKLNKNYFYLTMTYHLDVHKSL